MQSGTLGRGVAEVQDGLARTYADALSPDTDFDRPGFAAALTPMMWRLVVDRPGSTLFCGLVARSPTRLISVTAYSLEDAVYAAQVQR